MNISRGDRSHLEGILVHEWFQKLIGMVLSQILLFVALIHILELDQHLLSPRTFFFSYVPLPHYCTVLMP